MELAARRCEACRSDSPPVPDEAIAGLLSKVPDWELVERNDERRLKRTFTFPDFGQALTFTTEVGRLAEAEDHHPTILLRWGKVTVTWWTHAIRGLHENDFIMAAKSDAVYADHR
ncbi:MAG: 4a-hydroxytetrahydrobiopterin dehydratase [Thermomicrobiales bacterium]